MAFDLTTEFYSLPSPLYTQAHWSEGHHGNIGWDRIANLLRSHLRVATDFCESLSLSCAVPFLTSSLNRPFIFRPTWPQLGTLSAESFYDLSRKDPFSLLDYGFPQTGRACLWQANVFSVQKIVLEIAENGNQKAINNSQLTLVTRKISLTAKK